MVWFAILLMASANGVLREVILVPRVGKTPGLLLSGCLLSVLILVISFVAAPWLHVTRASHAIVVGAGWLVLTLAFEFSFGRYQGKPWSTLLEAYTFKDGNVWPLVLLVTAVAPYVAARSRGFV